MLHKSQDQIGKKRWASYAVVAWCVLFGGLHLYWALGGNAGLAEWSMPSNETAALTRAPLYIGLTWAVSVVCLIGVLAALAPIQTWGRHIPRWMPLTILWIACGISLVRGIGNPTQTLFILWGALPFEPLDGPFAQAWYEWLLLDSILFSPWFTLGGFLFGAAAWSARQHRENIGEGSVVSVRHA